FDMHKASPAVASPAYRVAERSRIPEYELPVSWRDRIDDEPAAVPAPSPVPAKIPHDEAATVTAEPPAAVHPPKIPVYRDTPEPAVEIIPTASGPLGDVEIPREPALEENVAETTRATVADSREPGLIPTLHQEPEEYSAMEREAAEMAPVESDFVASVPAARVPIAPAPPVSISDIS